MMSFSDVRNYRSTKQTILFFVGTGKIHLCCQNTLLGSHLFKPQVDLRGDEGPVRHNFAIQWMIMTFFVPKDLYQIYSLFTDFYYL